MTSTLFGILRICHPRFKSNCFKNEKLFLVFFFHFWNLHHILHILKKKKIVKATLFRKLQTVKDLFRPLSKNLPFRTRFDRQHVKWSQTLAKAAWEHFSNIFSSLWEKLMWKISPSVLCKILVVFPNTLTPNDKYPVWDCENLLSWIQKQLS